MAVRCVLLNGILSAGLGLLSATGPRTGIAGLDDQPVDDCGHGAIVRPDPPDGAIYWELPRTSRSRLDLRCGAGVRLGRLLTKYRADGHCGGYRAQARCLITGRRESA